MVRLLKSAVNVGGVLLLTAFLCTSGAAAAWNPPEAGRMPGLDPAVLRVAEQTDERAQATLERATRDLAERFAIPAPPAAPSTEPTAEAKDRAAAHFIRGRDAMAQNRFYVAIVEFDRGLQLNPRSAALLRQQARTYTIMGNTDRSAEFYERLRAVAPDDAESLIMLANAQAARGDFTTAAAAIAHFSNHDDALSFDPGALYVSSQILAFSLPALGYHRAALEAATIVLDMPEQLSGPSIFLGRINAIANQRDELLRVAGDSALRLGMAEEAMRSYEQALDRPGGDHTALVARLAVAAHRMGELDRLDHALSELISQAPAFGAIDPWLTELIIHLRKMKTPLENVHASIRNHGDRDSLAAQRFLAAAGSTDEAVAGLRASLENAVALAERDAEQLRHDLLSRLAERRTEDALREAVRMVEENPAHLRSIERSLFSALGASYETVAALRAFGSLPARLLTTEQLLRLGDLGAAAREVDELLKSTSDDPAVISAALTVAGRLGEPGRLEQAALLATRFESAALLCEQSEARLLIDDVPGAIRAAERATQLAPNEVRPWLMLGQARSLSAAEIRRAPGALEVARQRDPGDPRPYVVLLRLFDPRGPLADAERQRETIRSLVTHAPHAPLVEGLRVQELLENHRSNEAIERLIRLIDRTPTDTEALSLLVRTWLDDDRANDALNWLNDRRTQRPHDETLTEQRVRVLLRMDRAEDAYEELKAIAEQQPDDFVTLRLLETVCYATERREEAIGLAEKRLRSRPPGIRRDLDLVELHLVHEDSEAAARLLRPMLERFADSSETTLMRIMQLVEALPTIDPAYDDLRLRFVERYLSRVQTPDARVFIMGMRSVLRLDGLGESFDALAVAMVASGHEGKIRDGAGNVRLIRDGVQGLLSAGEPKAAARLAEVAFQSPRAWSRDALGLLVQMSLASYAASDQIDEAYSFLRMLDESDRLALVMNTDGGGDRLGAAYYSLSVLCTIIGREEAAERLLISALERRPNDAMAMNNLGYRRIEEGVNTAENASMIERAISQLPTNSNLLDTAGWLRYRQGRFAAGDGFDGPGAVELIERSLSESVRQGEAPSAEVLDHLGDTRWRLGSREGAKEAWMRAQSLLEDPAEREREKQNFMRYQMLGWGVLIESPDAIYDREFLPRLDSIRAKLAALERGESPPVAPTFAEAEEGIPRD